jgi:hypothetical protein
MNKLTQYKSQIFTFVTIALLMTYGIFPALTAANTLLNIVGSIGLLLLLVWGALELYSCFIPLEQDIKVTGTPQEIKPKSKSKSRPLVTVDFTDAKGISEIDNVITPIVEGRVKISVENPKPNRKAKTTK